MSRGELLRAVRARGVPARAWVVDQAIDAGALTPEPEWVAGRRVYVAAHVDQLAELVRARVQRQRVRALIREGA